MQPIFLIGYMGCGKSTLARAVSRAVGLDLIDLDTYIEGRFHKSITDIFASEGEARFRELEQRMLHEVADFEDVVVACGGGTPCFFDNMEFMNAHGLTVWLDATEERIHDRLVKARHKRPLVANKTDEEILAIIRSGLEQRRPFYSKAKLVFPSDLLEDRRQIDQSVAKFNELIGLTPLSAK